MTAVEDRRAKLAVWQVRELRTRNGDVVSLAKVDERKARLVELRYFGGRGTALHADGDGTTNIWSQPIDGSPAKQLTTFKCDQIFHFNWSRDGKLLVMARGPLSSDVVLINDLH